MNNIKNQFSIVDFENLSGIKAHTIRIWEKRYQMFNPERHGNNERLYNLDDLKKILNISFLQDNGWKISKIAVLSDDEMVATVNAIVAEKGKYTEAINQFKLAMLSFDQILFEINYQKLIIQRSFKEIFHEIFIPFLDLIGLLWQTGTIVPAHEHFITQLIENKLHLNIEKLKKLPSKTDKVFVLFLPENEIHNLGILYIQYELLLKGYKTLYLGHSIPLSDLKILQNLYDVIVFISQFTVSPSVELMEEYFYDLQNKLLDRPQDQCWINGRRAELARPYVYSQQVKLFQKTEELLKWI